MDSGSGTVVRWTGLSYLADAVVQEQDGHDEWEGFGMGRSLAFLFTIVMMAAGDPLGSGLVASLRRPGGNVTGMSLMAPDLGGNVIE